MMIPVLISTLFIILGSFAGAYSEPVRLDTREAPQALGPDDQLVIIVEDSLYGFVGMDGQVKVQPRFVEVGAFSEGRAAARETSLFGYIDRTGAWIIEPQFDFATDFSEGIAAVWVEGKARIIDTMGTVIHAGDYTKVGPCTGGYLEVYHGDARGLVSSHGVLLATPGVPYHILNDTHVLVADRVRDRKAGARQKMHWRILSHDGTMLRTFTSSYSGVRVTRGAPVFLLSADVSRSPSSEIRRYSMFTTKGDHVRDIEPALLDQIVLLLPCGHIVGSKKVDHPSTHSSDHRLVLLDHHGELVDIPVGTSPSQTTSLGSSSFIYVDRSKELVRYFNCSAQAVKETSYPVRDFEHKVLGEIEMDQNISTFRYRNPQVYGRGQHNGGQAILDSAGRWSATMALTSAHEVIHISKDRVYTVRRDVSTRSTRIEIFDWHAGGKPIATIPDVNDLLAVWDRGLTVVVGNRQVVMNESGAIVWSSKAAASSAVRKFGYSFKPEVLRTVYSNGAALIASLNESNARAASAIARSKTDTQAIHVVTVTDSASSKVEVYVVNVSNDTVRLNSCDNRLYLVMEARRSERDPWTEIEFLPSSWCGNSYYKVSLPGRSLWAFTVERYEGLWPVECRMKLTIGTDTDWWSDEYEDDTRISYSGPPVVYSAPFTAAVNPAQLWRVKEIYGKGLIDLY